MRKMLGIVLNENYASQNIKKNIYADSLQFN